MLSSYFDFFLIFYNSSLTLASSSLLLCQSGESKTQNKNAKCASWSNINQKYLISLPSLHFTKFLRVNWVNVIESFKYRNKLNSKHSCVSVHLWEEINIVNHLMPVYRKYIPYAKGIKFGSEYLTSWDSHPLYEWARQKYDLCEANTWGGGGIVCAHGYIQEYLTHQKAVRAGEKWREIPEWVPSLSGTGGQDQEQEQTAAGCDVPHDWSSVTNWGVICSGRISLDIQ